MTNYEQGKRVQLLVKLDLEADGYICFETPGSRGAADIVAIKVGQVLFVQVKKTNPLLTPADRVALLELARKANGVALVACKPFRKPIEYRELIGVGPKEWRPWVADQVMAT